MPESLADAMSRYPAYKHLSRVALRHQKTVREDQLQQNEKKYRDIITNLTTLRADFRKNLEEKQALDLPRLLGTQRKRDRFNLVKRTADAATVEKVNKNLLDIPVKITLDEAKRELFESKIRGDKGHLRAIEGYLEACA